MSNPLTHEQINDLMQEADAKWADADVPMHWARHFARAVEAAHNIMNREKPTKNPRAWACFADTGNCIIWSTDEASVRRAAEKHERAVTPMYDLASAPIAIMDTRDALGLCAPTEADFPALYALQGRRVALVDLGPDNVEEWKQK